MALDLRKVPPRRWSEQLGGIRWLPRLIDKARAVNAGTLGAYLYGQSPTDTGLLHTLGLGHRSFAELVAGAPDDDAVLASLRARNPQGVITAREWSDRLERKHRAFLFTLDLDDGRIGGGLGWLKPGINLASNALTWALKRIFPYRGSSEAVRPASANEKAP